MVTYCLGRTQDIAEGRGKGILDPTGRGRDFFIIRQGENIFAYRNTCPHKGTPLDLIPDHFICRYTGHILCATHGALFRIEDGMCLEGPCPGAHLTPISVHVEDGMIWVSIS
ncbi:MAG: Rieske (2Fe-2S) protein [Alphaproteobacteria bacterium]